VTVVALAGSGGGAAFGGQNPNTWRVCRAGALGHDRAPVGDLDRVRACGPDRPDEIGEGRSHVRIAFLRLHANVRETVTGAVEGDQVVSG
jgi:hypothetical protein